MGEPHGLQYVYFLIWAKNSLWMWLVYWVSGRQRLTANLEDYLVKNRFPPPPEYVSDIDERLDQVASGKQYDCSTRAKAAIELGTLEVFGSVGQIQLGLQLHLAYEDALQRYAKRFPPPPPPMADEWDDDRA